MPMGAFGVYVDNSGFPVKIWGFQREAARAKRRAACPTDRAHANRRAHVPNIARALLFLGNPKFSPGHARPPRPRKPQILRWACAPSPALEAPNSPRTWDRFLHASAPRGNPKISIGIPKFSKETPNSHWKPQFFPSNYLLAMCALRSASTCSLGHVHPPFGMCALPMETPNFCLETQNSPWKTQIFLRNPKFSLGHVRHPFGMRALPWTCAPFVWHVHPPYGIRALHWA
jgi:hypothetical protein